MGKYYTLVCSSSWDRNRSLETQKGTQGGANSAVSRRILIILKIPNANSQEQKQADLQPCIVCWKAIHWKEPHLPVWALYTVIIDGLPSSTLYMATDKLVFTFVPICGFLILLKYSLILQISCCPLVFLFALVKQAAYCMPEIELELDAELSIRATTCSGARNASSL